MQGIEIAAGRRTLPLALARLHAAMQVGDRLSCRLVGEGPTRQLTRTILYGAGFEKVRLAAAERDTVVSAIRAHALADWVGPDLRLLVCGLNPSIYSADSGVPFGRPGNRFWPALKRAGLVLHERDLEHALARQIGFTDLVKRATNASAELTPCEYRTGMERLALIVAEHTPRAVCFVGLEGWRAAVDRGARAGWIDGGVAGRPAYLMPSTSGRNAHATLSTITAHLIEAARARQ